MDMSKVYVKMCGQANELQKLYELHLKTDDESHEYFDDDFIWLPRQDQLLALLKDTHTIGVILQGLYWFCDPEHFCPNSDDEVSSCKCTSIGIERRKTFTSIEQFTLAFVMDELFDKVWNGEDWVKK